MEQRTNDQFDWTKHSGSTPTDIADGPTGPLSAHNGTYYIYIETSFPRRQGHRAYISTPAVNYSGDICVRFYYSMNGNQVGRLVVFTEQHGESQPVFEKEGAQGSGWQVREVTVNDFMEHDKVVFMGVVGNGHRGDIAIDYVTIHAGACNVCQVNNGGCDTFCVTLEEYPDSKCGCHHGYRIESDLFKCVEFIYKTTYARSTHECVQFGTETEQVGTETGNLFIFAGLYLHEHVRRHPHP